MKVEVNVMIFCKDWAAVERGGEGLGDMGKNFTG